MKNDKIDELVTKFIGNQTNENFANLIDALINERVMVIDRGLEGEIKKLSNDAITPLVISDNEGKNYIPIFSGDNHLLNDINKYKRVEYVFNELCNDSIVSNEYVEGYVLNPFTHGLKLPKEVIKIVMKYKEEK